MDKFIVKGNRIKARSKTSYLIKTDGKFDKSLGLKDLAFWFPKKMSKFIGKNEEGVHQLKVWAPSEFEFTTVNEKNRGSEPVGKFKLNELLLETDGEEVTEWTEK